MSWPRRLFGRLRTHAARLWSDRELRMATYVFGATTLLLLSTAQQGFVRDEGYYFKAARLYQAWFDELWRAIVALEPWRAFSDETLRRAFAYNTEHPGFVKLFMGFTWRLFHGVLGHATALRLAPILINALGCAFLYRLGAARFDRPSGLLAVALFLACPHVFYHLHLGAFDGPITALTIVTTYAFHRSLREPRFVWLCGLAFGLALATKHNAVFLLPTFAVALLIARRHELGREGGLHLPAVPLAFLAMLLIGPVILYAMYPYGWHAPLARLGDYYGYHLRHEHYPVDYFGTLYRAPPFPWSFPYVMSAITIPLPTLAAGLFGLSALVLRLWREPPSAARDWDGLLLLSVLVPPFIIAIPSVPIFGGTKHWMPMLPFFCVLAAAVVVVAGRTLEARFGRGAGAFMMGVAVLLTAIETVRTHPLGHTYYNELVLGHMGGAALGMPRGFWGGAGRSLLPTLNTQARPGALVYSHRMNPDSFRAYQEDQLIRPDLRWTNDLSQADWALIYHQREHQDAEYEIWRRKGDTRAVEVLAFDGVPIVSLYRLR